MEGVQSLLPLIPNWSYSQVYTVCTDCTSVYRNYMYNVGLLGPILKAVANK